MKKNSNKGFSLVELIVVIAIMAIIAAVAIPVYSTYVERAKKAKDKQLMDDIKYAVNLGFATTPANFDGLYTIKIKTNEDATVIGDTTSPIYQTIVTALSDSFGEDWASKLHLSYNWSASNVEFTVEKRHLAEQFAEAFTNSSYAGHEELMIESVGNLANSLSGFANLIPAAFSQNGLFGDADAGKYTLTDYLVDHGIASNNGDDGYTIEDANAQAAGNGAVLFLGESISNAAGNGLSGQSCVSALYQIGNDDELRNADMLTQIAAFGQLATGNEEGLDMFSTIGLVYMIVEGYATYEADLGDDTDVRALSQYSQDTDGDGVPDSGFFDMIGVLGDIIGKISMDGDYLENNMVKDINGAISVMKAVNAESERFYDSNGQHTENGKLENNDCYTDGEIAEVISSYITAAFELSEGEAIICVSANSNGTVKFTAYPIGF